MLYSFRTFPASVDVVPFDYYIRLADIQAHIQIS